MTLRLSSDNSLGVKTGFPFKGVGIGEWHCPEMDIPMWEFVEVMKYALTNTDLEADDPRLGFLEWAKSLTVAAGWNINNDPSSKRLKFTSISQPKEERE